MADDGFPPEEAGGAHPHGGPGGKDPQGGISGASGGSGASGAGGRGPRGRPGLGLLARVGHLEYDRVLFFSDAIFAIAITLLVIDIRVPGFRNDVAGQLSHARYNISSFAISFAVIGLFWMGHHSLFRYITVLDRPLIAINLAFLGTIAFLPYPTALLGQSKGPSTVAVVFYSACMALAGLGETAIWVYAAIVRDLLAPGTTSALRRYVTLRIIRVPVVFLLAIPVALISPSLGAYCWILIALTGIVVNRFVRPAAEAAEAAEAEDSAEPAG
jgi:uncharacterized membrane protein